MNAACSGKAEPRARLQPHWGSREWFRRLLSTQGETDPSAYFALSGYHAVRHSQIAAFLQRSRLPLGRAAMLDIGCGAGHLTALLCRQMGFREAVAIDFVPELIQQVRKRFPEIHAEVGSPTELSFGEKTFDLVVAAEVLYYLDASARRSALQEIHRVLKPGGVFLFTSAIGRRYFTLASAQEFIASQFRVLDMECPCHRLYHATVGRLTQLRRLSHIINRGGEPGSLESARRLESAAWLTRHRAFRLVLRTVCDLAEPALRARWIPRSMERACRLIAPRLTSTNINILAQKDA